MLIITQKQWDNLYALLSHLAIDTLAKISTYITENKYISNYSDYPLSVRKEYGLL